MDLLTLFPVTFGLTLTEVHVDQERRDIRLSLALNAPTAARPQYQVSSCHRHSRYDRHIRDLPWADLSPATVQAKLAVARALYKALRWAGATTASPFENVKVAKDPVPAWEKRGAYTPEEVEALLGVAEGPDRVMVLLGAHAGLRIAEMAALRWPDIDWRSKELVVRQGKGGKTARVAMTKRLRETLHECPRDAADLKGFVLPYRAYRARERFQKLCRLSGIEYKDKEVHGLRHGAGTRTYVQFKDLGRVAQHLRQASVDMARATPRWLIRLSVRASRSGEA